MKRMSQIKCPQCGKAANWTRANTPYGRTEYICSRGHVTIDSKNLYFEKERSRDVSPEEGAVIGGLILGGIIGFLVGGPIGALVGALIGVAANSD